MSPQANCGQCGDPPEEGDRLVRCRSCNERCCTTVCIAGKGCECFLCGQRNAERGDADEDDVDRFEEGEEDFPDEELSLREDGDD